MPVIVDASIQGKLKHPIMANVLSDNQKADYGRPASGTTEATQKNVNRLSREKGIFPIPQQGSTALEGTQVALEMGQDITVSVQQQFKGRNINAFA